MKTETRERGSGLFMVMLMATVIALLMIGLYNAVSVRSKVETYSSMEMIRHQGAESGLARARFMVRRHCDEETGANWLRKWAGTGSWTTLVTPNGPDQMVPVTWEDGATSFLVGDDVTGKVRVRVFVFDTEPANTDGFRNWYAVVSRSESLEIAPDGTETVTGITSLAMTMRPRDLFSRYARFVSTSDLSIGDNASYSGEVHSNADIIVNGKNIVFHENTTCTDIFRGTYYDATNSKGAPYTRFMREHQDGVGHIALPEANAIEALGENPPANSVLYDSRNVNFKSLCIDKTGYTPISTDRVDVDFVWKMDKMDTTVTVRSSGGTVRGTFTETNKDIPQNSLLYVRGDAKNKGNVASRMTLYSTRTVTFTGPVRYVNSGNEPQYTVYNNGLPTSFDSARNEWTSTSAWMGTTYEYDKTADWGPPEKDGTPFNPCLGVVAANDIYIDSCYRNAEIHAFLFSSNGVVRPTSDFGTQKYNLYVLGGLITTGTNPLSGAFRTRYYVYDREVMKNPPPHFPTTPEPVFRNWHILGTEPNADGTYRCTETNLDDHF